MVYKDPVIYKVFSDLYHQSRYDNIRYKTLGKLKKNKLKPVFIVPGFGDCLLMYKTQIIWPWTVYPEEDIRDKLRVTWRNGTISSIYKIFCSFKQEYSRFNLFLENLKSLGYKNRYDYYVLPYDFRIVGEPKYMFKLLEKFKLKIVSLYSNTNKKVMLVSYDLGTIVIQILLNNLEASFKEQFIDSSILLNPTIGGNIYSLHHCSNELNYTFSGIQLQLPHQDYYGQINEYYFNNLPYVVKYFYENVIKKFQEKSFRDTGVKTIIIRNLYCREIKDTSIHKFAQGKNIKIINLKFKDDENFLVKRKLQRKLFNFIIK